LVVGYINYKKKEKMKKQVLSFNEFIFEAYRVFETEEEAGEFIEAVSKLDASGMSSEAKNLMGTISGIAKSIETKNNKDLEAALGKQLLRFLEGITENGVEISKLETKINVISYDNIIGGSILLENNDRVKLMDWIYDINYANAYSKGSAGAYKKRGKSYWNKVTTDKRWIGPWGMSGKVGKVGHQTDLKWFGKGINWLAGFIPFKKKTKSTSSASNRDTKLLADSGLLGQEVITDVTSGIIITRQSEIKHRDMFWGGKARVGTDRRGFSNVAGDKKITTGYKIEIPLNSKLTNEQKLPTSNSAEKVSKVPKVYFTLVLYSVGPVSKSDREIPFAKLVKTEKTKTIGENSVEYTVDMYNNDSSGTPVLFNVNESGLLTEGKQNIDNAIEQFYSIDSIEIFGMASQEGDLARNKELCKLRAEAVATYIKSVKEWGIPAGSITTPEGGVKHKVDGKEYTVNIQPSTPTATEAERKLWRKVQLKIKGTKATPVDPTTETYIEYVPTIGKFNPDKADIQQICLCFEVTSSDTSIEGKA
jgi:outer membrane protein OmpA-like peptidoglycan-associated protein